MTNRTPITEEDHVHDQWYEDAVKQTAETLPEFLRHLTEDYQHDYGTICHAMTAAALGAAHAVNHSPAGDITGFQAGCVMWEFIQRWMHLKDKPLCLLNYEHMLYPQYDQKFAQTITLGTWEWLQKQARELLRTQREFTVGSVIAHWEMIKAGVVPFGYVVVSDEGR